MALTVTVSILLYDSASDIAACLAALDAQTRPADEVIILDNASTDDGLARARAALPGARFMRSPINLGFAAGQNRAMAFAPADIHLVLNPDARLRRDFLARALEPFERDPRLGSVTGRLLRFRPEDMPGNSAELLERELPDDTLDSTGLVAHRDRLFTERGAGDRAEGSHLDVDYVFGPSGAAAVYRREMLKNVAYQGEIYDESFGSYLDDVDLAWRAQLLGWRCEYAPAAVARPRRSLAPGRCEILQSPADRYSGRNQWRLLLKNELTAGWRSDWRRIIWGDAVNAGEMILREQSSMRALAAVARDIPGLWARHNDIMRRRVASDEEIMAWFGAAAERPLDEPPEFGGSPASAKGRALGRVHPARTPIVSASRPELPAAAAPMKIAIAGTRGVPAAYGGFETLAEQLGSRLVARGHQVTVYGRSHVVPAGLREYRGMRLRVLPTIRHKYLDTVAHTAISVLDTLPRRFDIVLICNNANAPFALVPRLTGAKVALNVDGLEWKRGKWGLAGRMYYRFCAWLSPKLPIVLVSDAHVIARYYRERHGKPTVYVPYGSDPFRAPPGETLASLGLRPGCYLLYVSRLEPENNAHVVLEAYEKAGGMAALGMPLVLVGDAPYATAYRRPLHDKAASVPGVQMPGYVFGAGYGELQSNCAIYIQATEVGGTHPALVEAMGRGACIIANDVPEHREVLGDAGCYYNRNSSASLAAAIRELVASPDQRTRLGELAAARAQVQYSWEHVTDEYEQLFRRMLRRRP